MKVMNEDKAKIQKAAEVLENHRIGEIAKVFLNHAYRFHSMPTLTFTRCTKLSCIENEVNGVILTHEGNELAIVTTKSRMSQAPDSLTSYADGIISYNSELVLKVTATSEHDEYGSYVDFNVYPHDIKSMKAGPWLNMMGSCYDILEADAKRREEEERVDRDRKQASDIDLGDY